MKRSVLDDCKKIANFPDEVKIKHINTGNVFTVVLMLGACCIVANCKDKRILE
jgi:hypothetical protein